MSSRHTPPKPGQPLTDRERQILRLIAQGRTDRAIARSLTISKRTASTHVRRMFVKLGACNRAHAVALGFDRGDLMRAGGGSC